MTTEVQSARKSRGNVGSVAKHGFYAFPPTSESAAERATADGKAKRRKDLTEIADWYRANGQTEEADNYAAQANAL